MRTIREHTIKNVAMYLKEIYNNCKQCKNVFSVDELAKKYNINKALPPLLQEVGIIAKTGGKGRGVKTSWEWVTKVEPNLKMAKEILIKYNEIQAIRIFVNKQISKLKKESEESIRLLSTELEELTEKVDEKMELELSESKIIEVINLKVTESINAMYQHLVKDEKVVSKEQLLATYQNLNVKLFKQEKEFDKFKKMLKVQKPSLFKRIWKAIPKFKITRNLKQNLFIL